MQKFVSSETFLNILGNNVSATMFPRLRGPSSKILLKTEVSLHVVFCISSFPAISLIAHRFSPLWLSLFKLHLLECFRPSLFLLMS